MRKNVLVSLLAVTSASMTAYANANLSDQIKNNQVSDWDGAGEGFDFDGGKLVSPGASVSQSIGKLVPGTYKFSAGEKSDNVKLIVKVGGTEVENSAEFVVSTESEVEIVIESTDGQGYAVGGFKLELIFDFAATKQTYTTRLSEVTNKLSDIMDAPGSLDMISRSSSIQADINKLVDDGDNAHAAYDVYKTYELYAGESTIQKAIKDLDVAVDKVVANHTAYATAIAAYNELTTNLETVKTKYNAARDYTKGKYKETLETLETSIEALKKGVEEAYKEQTAADKYSVESTEKFKNETATGLTELDANIVSADADDVAYNAVVPKIAAVKQNYTTALNTVNANIPSEGVYADKHAEAQKKLGDAYQLITEAETANGTVGAHDNAAESQAVNENNIAEAQNLIDEIPDIVKLVQDCQVKYKDATHKLDSISKNFTELKGVLGENSDYKEQIGGIDTKISALGEAIEAANTKHDFSGIDDKFTEVEGLIEDFKTTAGDIFANYDAKVEVEEAIKGLTEYFDAQKELVAKLQSDDKKYSAVGKYTGLENNFDTEITSLSTSIEKDYNAGKADDNKVTYLRDIESLKTEIGTYVSNAQAVVAKYNTEIVKLETVENAYKVLADTVTNKSVWVNRDKSTTYGAKLTAFAATIKEYNDSLKSALDATDAKHVEKVLALSFDASIADEMNNLAESYDADLAYYNQNISVATAESMHNSIGNRIDAVEVSLTALEDNNTEEALGLYYSAEGGFKATLDSLTDVKTDLANKEEQTYISGAQDSFAAYLAYVGEALNTLKDLEESVATLGAKATEAKNLVQRNNKALAAAKELETEITGELNKVADANEDLTRTQEFAEAVTKRTEAVAAIMAKVNEDRSKETLDSAYYVNTYKASLETELKKAKDLVALAKASTTNYNVKEELEKYLNEKDIPSIIAQTVGEVAAATNNSSAYPYYKNLLEGEKNEAYNNLGKSITDTYNERKFTDEKEDVKNWKVKIDALVNEIKGVVTSCEANEKAYDSQMAELTGTQTTWNSVYDKIQNDASSKKDYWLEELDGIKADMTGLATQIADNYMNGQSESFDETVTSSLAQYNIDIKTVADNQEKGYDAVIAEDNANRYMEFTAELQKTVDDYNNAVSVLGKYNNIQNTAVQEVVNQPEYKVSSDSIMTYSAKLNALRNDARNAYQRTEAGVVFENEAYIQLAHTYSTEIDGCLTAISDLVKVTTTSTVQGYIDEANDALAEYEGKISSFDESLKNTAYKDVNDIISGWEAALNSNELPVLIDEFEIESESIEAMLKSACEEITDEQWTKFDLAEFDKTVAEQKEDLVEWGFDLTDYNAVLSNEENGRPFIDAAVTEAKGYNSFNENYSGIKGWLDNLSSNLDVIYNAAKSQHDNDVANKQAYADVMKAISDARDSLTYAAEYADKYFFVDGTVEENVTGWESRLNDLAIEAGEEQATISASKDSYITRTNAIVSEINAFYIRVNVIEYNALVAQVNSLHEYYNTLLTSVSGTDNEAAVKAFEPKLAELEAMLEEYSLLGTEGKDETVQNNLISVEKAISAVKNGLTAIEDSSKAETAYNVTLANLEALASEYAAENTTLGECYEQVQIKFAARMNEIKSGIDDVRISLESYKSDILFYQDKVQHAIDLLNTDLDNIAIEIAAEQKIYVDNQTAYERLSAEINGYEKELQDAIDVINGYASDEFTSYFNGAYTPVDNSGKITVAKEVVDKSVAKLRAKLEEAYTSTERDDMLNSTSTLEKLVPGQVSTIESEIITLEKEAASDELNKRITEFKTKVENQMTELQDGFYTQQAKDEYAGQLEAIKTTLNKLDAHITDAWDGSYTADIDGNECPEVTVTDYMSEIAEKAFTRINEQLAAYSGISDAIDNSAYKLGDVDEDGVVTVRDYGRILDMVLADVYPEAGSVEALAADCNEDGAINIGDVTKVAQLINDEGGDATTSMLTKRYARMTANNDMLSLSSESEGNVTRVAINLANSVAYAGGQMDIKLPAGMVLVSERLGARANGHELRSNDLANGIHRIVVSSAEANVLTDAEQTVVYLEVSGEGSVDNIEITNIKFADANARVYSLPDLNVGNATGINGVEGSESLRSKIYSVGGQLMNKVKKGINIIRNSDGSTRKVVNKK